MAYKQNNPFSRKATSFDKKTDEIIADLPTFNYRGKDTYGEVVDKAHIQTPYAKEYGTDKKYPYLSSRHHTMNSIHNPMLTNPRRSKIEDGTEMDEGILTIAEERKRYQDRLLNEGEDLAAGTKGSTYFGSEFNKKAEKDAKQAVKRHEYLSSIAGNEEALRAALSTEKRPNKFGVMVNQEMPVREQFPMDPGRRSRQQFQTGTRNNPGEPIVGYAANPAGQSLRNIHNFQDLMDRAASAQDLVDYNRGLQGRVKNMNYDLRSGTIIDPRSGKVL